MRVLIIEDEYEMAAAMKLGLDSQGFSTDLACTGEEGLLQSECNEYNAVLLDLNLPDMDGMRCSSCHGPRGDTPAHHLRPGGGIRNPTGLDRGADDYVTKPFDLFVLASRIRAVVRRSFGISRGDIRVGQLVVEPARRLARYGNTVIDLSAKEYVLLECLAQRSPNFVTAEELLSYAYDDRVDPFSSVIRVHLANIRKKLSSITDRVEILSLKGKGYRLCEKPDDSI